MSLRLVIVILVLAGCGSEPQGSSSSPRFRTVPVERGTLAVTIEATGTLQPATQVEVGSRVGGQISRVLVDFNDPVKTGQLLAEIDATSLRARRDEARAVEKSARAELDRSKAELTLREQAAARALDLASRRLNSQADVEAAVSARDVARAQVAVAEAQLARAAAALASAETDLAATRIVSPIDGIVLSRAVEAGQTVAASFSTPRLFVIAASLDALEVIANVDEADLAVVRPGAAAELKVDAFAGRRFTATVKQIRIDPKTESGVVTFPVVLVVENTDHALLPGMTATVTIAAPPVENALLVPAAALRFTPSSAMTNARENGGQVWVLRDGVPVLRRVRALAKARGRVQIAAVEGDDGIDVGTPVIVEELGLSPRGGGGGRGGPPRIF